MFYIALGKNKFLKCLGDSKLHPLLSTVQPFGLFLVSLFKYLEITEHKLALAMLKLSMEPGLANSGKVKVISMPFIRIITRNRVI